MEGLFYTPHIKRYRDPSPSTRKETAIETLPDEEDYRTHLARLSDDGAAGAAFDRLWRLPRDATRRLAIRRGLSADEADDVAQEVYARLWRHQRSIRVQAIGEWYALVRKTTLHAALALRPPLDFAELEEIPDEDLRHLDGILRHRRGRRLYRAANDLGVLSVRPSTERTPRSAPPPSSSPTASPPPCSKATATAGLTPRRPSPAPFSPPFACPTTPLPATSSVLPAPYLARARRLGRTRNRRAPRRWQSRQKGAALVSAPCHGPTSKGVSP